MAIALRFVVAVMKINSDLEHIADHATNIAEDVVQMVEGAIVRHRPHFPADPAGQHRD